MPTYNDKKKIIEHYNLLSPYYRDLWGEHLHHGYWATGSESKEEAQLALTAHLAETAQIPEGASVLDAGCGFGGSSIYLAGKYQATVTGITISSIQAAIARRSAELAKVAARFLVMDAENITLRDQFDVIWSIEAISHLSNKAGFFSQAARLLRPAGTLALIDWFKRGCLSIMQHRSEIARIERGMLVELKSMTDYSEMIRSSGLDILHTSDLSARCARTWDISLDLIRNRALWGLARRRGGDFVRFLRCFKEMRKAFASGSFVYGMIIAKKR